MTLFRCCLVLIIIILTEIDFFSLKKDNRTRGHEVTLVKDQCRLDIRKYSLTHISRGRITHMLKMLDTQ